jgi:hypothetical protein
VRRGRSGRVLEIYPPPEFHLRTVQSVAGRYTNFVIPARNFEKQLLICASRTRMSENPLTDCLRLEELLYIHSDIT